MKLSDLSTELFNRYGAVKRARGCFLYTKKGVRLTDLYQEAGRAILGWEGASAFTLFKNVLSRGQTGSFICEEAPVSRLQKAVSELLASDRIIFCFSSHKDAFEAGLTLFPDETSLYRPWNAQNEKIKINQQAALIVTPPLPWAQSIYILALDAKKVEENPDRLLFIRNAIKLPFALEVAITRSIYNLIKALQERQEKDWFIYDPLLTKYWNREGPYLFPKVPQDNYKDFVLHCLDCGLVISPDYNQPSIVPFGADRGVFTKLKNSPFTWE
jgi:hypothetical protein